MLLGQRRENHTKDISSLWERYSNSCLIILILINKYLFLEKLYSVLLEGTMWRNKRNISLPKEEYPFW